MVKMLLFFVCSFPPVLSKIQFLRLEPAFLRVPQINLAFVNLKLLTPLEFLFKSLLFYLNLQ